jgi:hypothetical protein
VDAGIAAGVEAIALWIIDPAVPAAAVDGRGPRASRW